MYEQFGNFPKIPEILWKKFESNGPRDDILNSSVYLKNSNLSGFIPEIK